MSRDRHNLKAWELVVTTLLLFGVIMILVIMVLLVTAHG